MKISEWQHLVHQNAKDKGWWDTEISPSFGDKIALVHSELSEALEEFRNGHVPDEIYFNFDEVSDSKKPEGVPIELADTVIRIMDMCAYYGIDLETAIAVKHKYNESRPYRHGGKRI